MGRLHEFAEALKAGFVVAGPPYSAEDVNQALVPPHVGSPEDSIFHIVSESSFNSLSTREVLEILAKKCVVVTDSARQQLQFDARGLSTLSTLSTVVPIQGMALLHVVKLHELIGCRRSIPWA